MTKLDGRKKQGRTSGRVIECFVEPAMAISGGYLLITATMIYNKLRK